MAETDPLTIEVDTDVRVPSGVTPRRVVEAIRRQLRQHDLGVVAGEDERRLMSLLQTRGGRHRMPQGLLSRLTETCQRYDVPYRVVDRRAMVSCPALRNRLSLGPQEQQAVRRLLLRDSGVIVAETEESRCAVAVELVARRQQRTLVAAGSGAAAAWWIQQLRLGLGLPPAQICLLPEATPDAWIVVGQYGTLLELPAPIQREGFGLLICDGLASVDAVTLMRTIRSAGARYLLGLAERPTRSDGLHDTVSLALGGVVERLAGASAAAPIQLGVRLCATVFEFPGYEGRSQYQALLAALAADEERAEAVARDVAREAGAGHPCLVLSERRDHIDNIARRLPEGIACETINSTVRPADRARIIARFERGELVVLLATSQIAVDAITSPRVRRLFLTFPFSYTRKLNKLVARLVEPSEGKEDAVLYDYDDANVETLHRAFDKRRAFLRRLRRQSEEQVKRQRQLDLF